VSYIPVIQTFHFDANVQQRDDGVLARSKLRSIRQHVNPLASTYMEPLILSNEWITQHYANPKLPFLIDIGSARGQFVISMAKLTPDFNLLGLEIRRPCVEEVRRKLLPIMVLRDD